MRNEWTDRKNRREQNNLDQMRAEIKAELEAEYNAKLEQAYAALSEELNANEKVAYQGYEEAYQIITDLRNRLESQKQEFEATLEEGYEEAYQMLQAEREKNNTLEVTLYEEYEVKLKEIKEYIVNKVDQYLTHKWQELHEAEEGGISEKLLERWRLMIPSTYMVEEAIEGNWEKSRAIAAENATPKFKKQQDEIDELKAQMKILEARNMRLSIECEKLRKTATAATASEKEVRQKAGLPDEPIMENFMKQGLLGKLKKKLPDVPSEQEFFEQKMAEHEAINEQLRGQD